MARAILRMPKPDRKDWLFGPMDDTGKRYGGYQKQHGKEAAEKLKAFVENYYAAARANQYNRQ